MLILPKIIEVANEYACITLYGARQNGKSTMIRNLFPEYEYVTLDSTKERILATDEPDFEYSGAAEPTVRRGVSYLSGLTEPPNC